MLVKVSDLELGNFFYYSSETGKKPQSKFYHVKLAQDIYWSMKTFTQVAIDPDTEVIRAGQIACQTEAVTRVFAPLERL